MEKAIALATTKTAPATARINAAQSLRIVACGPDDDGALEPALLARGYEVALEATAPLLPRGGRGSAGSGGGVGGNAAVDSGGGVGGDGLHGAPPVTHKHGPTCNH